MIVTMSLTFTDVGVTCTISTATSTFWARAGAAPTHTSASTTADGVRATLMPDTKFA